MEKLNCYIQDNGGEFVLGEFKNLCKGDIFILTGNPEITEGDVFKACRADSDAYPLDPIIKDDSFPVLGVKCVPLTWGFN